MKKFLVQNSILAVLLVAAGGANAQADSTTGNGFGNWNPKIPLRYQERETPVVNTTTQVTQIQQINGAELVDSSSFDVSNTGCGFGEGTAQWMLSCGKRRCVDYGYTSGYVVEYYGGSVTLACQR